jgi:hypothetical protein
VHAFTEAGAHALSVSHVSSGEELPNSPFSFFVNAAAASAATSLDSLKGLTEHNPATQGGLLLEVEALDAYNNSVREDHGFKVVVERRQSSADVLVLDGGARRAGEEAEFVEEFDLAPPSYRAELLWEEDVEEDVELEVTFTLNGELLRGSPRHLKVLKREVEEDEGLFTTQNVYEGASERVATAVPRPPPPRPP